jgi:hypothetical protein
VTGIALAAAAMSVPLAWSLGHAHMSLKPELPVGMLHMTSLMAQTDPETGVVVTKDPRGLISAKARELDLNSEEVTRIRKTCGYVFCADPRQLREGPLYAYIGSGCLVGPSGMQVMTARHVIFDDDGRPRSSQCYIQNQDVPFARAKLDLQHFYVFSFTNSPARGANNSELMVVRLQGKLTSWRPFPFAKTDLRDDQPMILVSAFQGRMPINNDGREPIVQKCYSHSTNRLLPGLPTEIFGDCSQTPGASGSVAFVTGEGGKLYISSVLVGEGGRSQDGCVYDRDKECFSYTLGVNPDVVDIIVQFESGAKAGHHRAGE